MAVIIILFSDDWMTSSHASSIWKTDRAIRELTPLFDMLLILGVFYNFLTLDEKVTQSVFFFFLTVDPWVLSL